MAVYGGERPCQRVLTTLRTHHVNPYSTNSMVDILIAYAISSGTLALLQEALCDLADLGMRF